MEKSIKKFIFLFIFVFLSFYSSPILAKVFSQEHVIYIRSQKVDRGTAIGEGKWDPGKYSPWVFEGKLGGSAGHTYFEIPLIFQIKADHLWQGMKNEVGISLRVGPGKVKERVGIQATVGSSLKVPVGYQNGKIQTKEVQTGNLGLDFLFDIENNNFKAGFDKYGEAGDTVDYLDPELLEKKAERPKASLKNLKKSLKKKIKEKAKKSMKKPEPKDMAGKIVDLFNPGPKAIFLMKSNSLKLDLEAFAINEIGEGQQLKLFVNGGYVKSTPLVWKREETKKVSIYIPKLSKKHSWNLVLVAENIEYEGEFFHKLTGNVVAEASGLFGKEGGEIPGFNTSEKKIYYDLSSVRLASLPLEKKEYPDLAVVFAQGKRGFLKRIPKNPSDFYKTDFQIEAKIKNLGKKEAKNFLFQVKWDGSPKGLSSFCYSQNLVSAQKTEKINSLKPDEEKRFSFNLSGFFTSPSQKFKVCVDAKDQVEESDENNNCQEINVKFLERKDYRVLSFKGPENLTVGKKYKYDFEIERVGTKKGKITVLFKRGFKTLAKKEYENKDLIKGSFEFRPQIPGSSLLALQIMGDGNFDNNFKVKDIKVIQKDKKVKIKIKDEVGNELDKSNFYLILDSDLDQNFEQFYSLLPDFVKLPANKKIKLCLIHYQNEYLKSCKEVRIADQDEIEFKVEPKEKPELSVESIYFRKGKIGVLVANKGGKKAENVKVVCYKEWNYGDKTYWEPFESKNVTLDILESKILEFKKESGKIKCDINGDKKYSEYDFSNNSLEKIPEEEPELADLAGKIKGVEKEIYFGKDFKVKIEIENKGKKKAENFGYQIVQESIEMGGNKELYKVVATGTIDSLDAGRKIEKEVKVKLEDPLFSLNSPRTYLHLIVDPENKILEENKDNNRHLFFDITNNIFLPDLLPGEISPKRLDVLQAGQENTIGIEIKNDTEVAGHDLKVYFWLDDRADPKETEIDHILPKSTKTALVGLSNVKRGIHKIVVDFIQNHPREKGRKNNKVKKEILACGGNDFALFKDKANLKVDSFFGSFFKKLLGKERIKPFVKIYNLGKERGFVKINYYIDGKKAKEYSLYFGPCSVEKISPLILNGKHKYKIEIENKDDDPTNNVIEMEVKNGIFALNFVEKDQTKDAFFDIVPLFNEKDIIPQKIKEKIKDKKIHFQAGKFFFTAYFEKGNIVQFKEGKEKQAFGKLVFDKKFLLSLKGKPKQEKINSLSLGFKEGKIKFVEYGIFGRIKSFFSNLKLSFSSLLEKIPLFKTKAVCGNKICERGEIFENCCQDCGCPEKEVCYQGKCEKIACFSDLDCLDGDTLTKDICQNPGEIGAKCLHQEKEKVKETKEKPKEKKKETKVACKNNGDCDDRNSCTIDVCENAGTEKAKCSHSLITQCKDGDGCCPQDCNAKNDSDCKAECGNSICEPTENSENCCQDCGCKEGEVCKDNKCQKVACFEDKECDDQNSCTVNICENPGTENAKCKHNLITECKSNDGCCPEGCNSLNDSDCEIVCGNGACEKGETKCNCPQDCGKCQGSCKEEPCWQWQCVNGECQCELKENCCPNSICEQGEFNLDCQNFIYQSSCSDCCPVYPMTEEYNPPDASCACPPGTQKVIVNPDTGEFICECPPQ